MSRVTLSRVLHCHTRISPNLAVRLEEDGVSTARFWLTMQAAAGPAERDPAMDLVVPQECKTAAMGPTRVDELLAGLDGVRRSGGTAPMRWSYHGRLVARQLDDTHLVIRADFDHRDTLVRQYPDTFEVPARFRHHMMVVADLDSGDEDAIEDALMAAWALQRAAD